MPGILLQRRAPPQTAFSYITRMAVSYHAIDPARGPVRYRDRKRWAWALSVIYPLMPFIGIAAHALTGYQVLLALPLVISYGLMPLLDAHDR